MNTDEVYREEVSGKILFGLLAAFILSVAFLFKVINERQQTGEYHGERLALEEQARLLALEVQINERRADAEERLVEANTRIAINGEWLHSERLKQELERKARHHKPAHSIIEVQGSGLHDSVRDLKTLPGYEHR